MKKIIILVAGTVFLLGCSSDSPSTAAALDDPDDELDKGLNAVAMEELAMVGLNKYMGDFEPAMTIDVGDGCTQHIFDPDGGNGPMCIAGTPLSAYTKARNPANLLIMLQGGGACWQDFYFCNILAEDQAPPPPPVGIWEAFYSTDGDMTNRFFLNVPTQVDYRDLIVTEHGLLHDAHPDRYKRFIRSGDDSHTALQTPLFYMGEANGVPLHEWTDDFLVPRPFWVDIVEDFVPIP